MTSDDHDRTDPRRSSRNFDDDDDETDRKLAIICSKGNLDMAYPGLILGNAALGEGIETHLFFTFWGFDMIMKSRMHDLQFSPAGNTAMHLPGSDRHMPQALAPCRMTGMATKMLKKQIADLGVPRCPDFLDQIVAAGGHLWACRLSADMMKVAEDRPARRRRGHHQRRRLHREDRGRSAALHLTRSTHLEHQRRPPQGSGRPFARPHGATRWWGERRGVRRASGRTAHRPRHRGGDIRGRGGPGGAAAQRVVPPAGLRGRHRVPAARRSVGGADPAPAGRPDGVPPGRARRRRRHGDGPRPGQPAPGSRRLRRALTA